MWVGDVKAVRGVMEVERNMMGQLAWCERDMTMSDEREACPPAAAPSMFKKVSVMLDHGCSKYARAPCKPSWSEYVHKETDG